MNYLTKQAFLLLAIVFLSSVLTGCAGRTTDPHEGGLFAYNPDAYKKRGDDLTKKLQKTEAQEKEEKELSLWLEKRNMLRKQQVEELKTEILLTQNRLRELQAQVMRVKTTSVEATLRQAALQKELEAMIHAQPIRNGDTAELQAQLDELKERRAEIFEELDILADL